MLLSSGSDSPPAVLKLLAHEVRWQLLAALAHSDYRVQELVERVGRPMNLVSYHLKQLRSGGLVSERRSSADGRDIYYSVELDRLAERYQAGGVQLHPALGGLVSSGHERAEPLRVLFLCTHNSARSQMAEGLLHRLGGSQVEVASAGSEPAVVHPLAVAAMQLLQIDISGQRAKHLDEFRERRFDHVITVCDAVRERCPVFPGDPDRVHWSIADPAAVDGDEEERSRVFVETAQLLAARVRHFLHRHHLPAGHNEG